MKDFLTLNDTWSWDKLVRLSPQNLRDFVGDLSYQKV
jgi:hypothetical protein